MQNDILILLLNATFYGQVHRNGQPGPIGHYATKLPRGGLPHASAGCGAASQLFLT